MTGYKTLIANTLIAVFALIRYFYPELILPGEEEVEQFSGAIDMIIVGVTLVVNFILRFFTKTPVFKKE